LSGGDVEPHRKPKAQAYGVRGSYRNSAIEWGSLNCGGAKVSHPPYNSMQNLNAVTIPAGTTFYVGPASAQSPYTGGGIQVYVP
jgi:hypothetical protein